ncbi:hypothetical protein FPV67DRAFT_1677621 [Lyophyllum atratum]|nr:hypothetical protein FPV67DRAFT_1677621 [Lyophyllum atratum]
MSNRQLRPRKTAHANKQLGASAHTPSFQEFQQLERVEPLIIEDAVESRKQGKQVCVEFCGDDDVFIRHVDIPSEPEPEEYWKAKIHAIAYDGATGKTWVAVKWYYSKSHLQDGGFSWQTGSEKAIFPRLGGTELVLSDHVDVIEPQTIESPLNVVAFDDHLYVSHVPRRSWFTRLTVKLTRGCGSLEGVNKSCICGRIYDPEQDIQRYCRECTLWYHHACMDINLAYEPDPTLSRAATIAQIPCSAALGQNFHDLKVGWSPMTFRKTGEDYWVKSFVPWQRAQIGVDTSALGAKQ